MTTHRLDNAADLARSAPALLPAAPHGAVWTAPAALWLDCTPGPRQPPAILAEVERAARAAPPPGPPPPAAPGPARCRGPAPV